MEAGDSGGRWVRTRAWSAAARMDVTTGALGLLLK